MKHIEHLECLPGIVHESITDLSSKAEHLEDIDKVCIVMFDEMKISELYDYHGKSDSVFGGHKFVQMVMAKGLIGKKWKEVIHYDFDVLADIQ